MAYRAWSDPDRRLLRTIGTVPAETPPERPAWRPALGLPVAGAVLGTAGMLLSDRFTETVAGGLVVASIVAVTKTVRAVQLWAWERRHPGTELVYLADSNGSWIAARRRMARHRELAAVFGR